jgi:hypothetical protein
MKAHMIRERSPETGDWGRDWKAWLRVPRLDIEAMENSGSKAAGQRFKPASAVKDDRHIYLGGTDKDSDLQRFYTAMMARGAYFEQYGYSLGAKDADGLDLNYIEIGGERQTFEWCEGRSLIRDLEPVG